MQRVQKPGVETYGNSVRGTPFQFLLILVVNAFAAGTQLAVMLLVVTYLQQAKHIAVPAAGTALSVFAISMMGGYLQQAVDNDSKLEDNSHPARGTAYVNVDHLAGYRPSRLDVNDSQRHRVFRDLPYFTGPQGNPVSHNRRVGPGNSLHPGLGRLHRPVVWDD